ncbi:hypothetical protein AKMV043 [Akhmeta virus]|uniref:Uncharacterized protein n=1 Tax=Orthopoxvirus akhmetapox TaxID=2200830 RepID=A0A346FSM4_9POXV|nr:hypothetical protein KM542_gp043 [Akhmeta virus]AXN74828.1 hypothetical protein AKMV-88-043 [Akhmeta virus]AXN75048.1 hypothetical protein AKMV043 [Akhmeta virus]AXN75267.1 hypothetical protein AKMV-Vani-043 [Akhmeta virus]QEQ49380.1 hypothetical protein [Akhmeta virus]
MLMHSYYISSVKKNYPIMYLRVLYVTNMIPAIPIIFRYSRVLWMALSRGAEMYVI